MRSVFEPIGHLISRHPGAVAVGYLCLLLIALYGTTMITMNTGSGTYMDKSTEAGILFDTYTQTFDSNAVVLLIESSDVLSPESSSIWTRSKWCSGSNSTSGRSARSPT